MRYRSGKLEDPADTSFEHSAEYRAIIFSEKPILLTRETGVENPGASYRIGVPLTMKGNNVGAMLLHKNEDGVPFTEADIRLLSALSNHAMVALENALLYESLKTNYVATIQSLVNALEASDRFTKGHSERVRLLSVELGKHIGLEAREIELLEQASILHDIGKIGIDNFILQKQGRLTAKEYSLIKTHPLIGDEILGPIGTLQTVRSTIIQHHERYDGNGYPYGLRGNEISLKSKILSVVDTFDAMMTDRPYRKALTLQKVKEELKLNSGTQFDPYVVESFAGMLDKKGHELLTAAGYNSLYSV
jgi:HD-GYP domain-containing protein (c-di-GMP phosphodiesterase class II)